MTDTKHTQTRTTNAQPADSTAAEQPTQPEQPAQPVVDLEEQFEFDSDETTRVSVRADALDKQMIEALCYDFYDSSQSSGIIHILWQTWIEVAGKLHPGAVLCDELEEITADAVLAGEVNVDELPDEYTLEGDVDALDLGSQDQEDNRGRANSYTPTFTPDDLASEGRALTWEELKDAVRRHWGPNLEIHPDRVDAERLKRNREFNAKVIAGILRNQHSTVSDAKIEMYIDEYLGHQIERADYDAGLAFKVEKHKPLITEHLESYPNLTGGMYYASEEAARERLPQVVDTIRDQYDENRAITPTSWTQRNLTTMDTLRTDGETLDEWLADLAKYRRKLAKLSAIRRDGSVMDHLRGGNLEYDDDEYADAAECLNSLYKAMKSDYRRAPVHARYVVWNEHLGNLTDSFRISEDVEREAVADFSYYENDDGKMPKADRLKIVAKNLET